MTAYTAVRAPSTYSVGSGGEARGSFDIRDGDGIVLTTVSYDALGGDQAARIALAKAGWRALRATGGRWQVERVPWAQAWELAVVEQLAGLPPAERLVALSRLPAEADAAMRSTVAELRAEGRSWQAIGDILGVSRQTVHERFGESHR